uniref:RNA exonuclease 4 n=1 Tax=Sinocyclocheilus anshuiensis TaxID=1608454 RepID=A0A671QQU2_9TELE
KMSEVKLKKHAENVQTNGQSNHEKKKKKHENNKKTFFYDTKTVVKKKTKPTTVKPNIKPPTKVEEYSCNWKKLLQLPYCPLETLFPLRPDIWFDDVDPDDIEAALGPEAADIVRKRSGMLKSSAEVTEKVLVKEHGFEGLTRAVAMDCEMVGVGCDGEDSILARVSIVNHFGKCIYDKYIKPTEKVMDYRTAVSGIRPADIENGEDIKTVQKEVAQILEGRILVGHAIHNDLKILLLDHPKKMIRDTQKYKPFRQRVKSARPALRVLCKEILSVKVQQGEHSSVQDAQATMRLYTLVKKQWEAELKAARAGQFQKSPRKPKTPKNQSKLIQISR